MSLVYLGTLPLPDAWFAELAARVPEVEIHRASEEGAVDAAVLARVDLLHTGDVFPAAATMPRLRAVQLDTSGVDHVRQTDLWATGVPIATLGGIAPIPMAEYALMTILELAHRVPLLQERYRAERRWPSNAERLAELTPRQLAGATLGIVGYGRIGREISRLAAAFGMSVVGVKRSLGTAGGERFDTGRRGVADDPTEILPIARLDEALRRSDVLVVVVPLTAATAGLIGGRELDLLPPGALVVNIARGGIVDEGALLERLRSGALGGVALDVFDSEPLPADSPWWTEPGALVTPHVAGLAPQYHAQTLDLVVENLRRLADGRPILNEVNRDSGY